MRLPIGLRTKFFLYSNTLIVGTMLLVFTSGSGTSDDAVGGHRARGRSIVEALAIPITDALMYEDSLVAETGLIENVSRRSLHATATSCATWSSPRQRVS